MGSVPAECALRQLGARPGPQPARSLQYAAEDNLVAKRHLTERHCEVPDEPRSTFLMVFSPDGTKVASTHGNHNVYVSELSTGKHVKTLSGHPRTPWCVAFHPSHTQLLASGCLGGQVRVWDLSGGSEVWTVSTETVIASIAFHPRDQLLVIATFNELHFWDWSQPAPTISVKTNSIKSKVRFVAFDALGHKLITGISCWNYPVSSGSIVQPVPYLPPENSSSRASAGSSSHEQIVSSYHHLVQRYDSLVRNYHHLIMGRSQLANTTDRGTDPMEIDWSNSPASIAARAQAANSGSNPNTNESTNIIEPSTSRSNTSHSLYNVTPILMVNQNNTQIGESSLLDPRPSTSQSAFQPVTSSTNTSSGSSQIPPSSSTSPPRDNSANSSPNQAMRNELTASLNRLQGFMENSIDQTLNLWERYDAARSSSLHLMNVLRDFPSSRSNNRASVDLFDGPRAVNLSRLPIPSVLDESSPPRSDRPRFEELSPVYSQNSESSNDNMDDQRFDAINDVLRESGNRLLNLLAGVRGSRDEQASRTENNATATLAMESDNAPPNVDRTNRPRVIVYRSENGGEANSNRNSREEEERRSREQYQLMLSRCQSYSANSNNQGVAPTTNNDSNLSSSSREPDESINPNDVVPGPDPIPDPIPSVDEFQQSNQEANSSRSAQEGSSSTSRSNDAFERVTRGVYVIERHTEALISLWNSGQTSLSRVRGMWEELRREIISLQRSTDHEAVGCFSLSPLERCRLLNNSLINRPRSVNRVPPNSPGRSNAQPNNVAINQSALRINRLKNDRSSALPKFFASGSPRTRNVVGERLTNRVRPLYNMLRNIRNLERNQSTPDDPNQDNASPSTSNPRPNIESIIPPMSAFTSTRPSNRTILSLMRRHRSRQLASRSRHIRLQEIGHRRNVMNIRRGELDVTRDRIRMRARRVLAIMFSIMMDCLEADQLSNRIITMLRLLKKALSVTCLLLVAHLFYDEPSRANPHSERNASSSQERQSDESPSTAEPNQPSSSQSNQNLSADNLASRIQEHRNDIYVQIRRSRTLLRLDSLPRPRRRVGLPCRIPNDPRPPADNSSQDNAPSTTAEQSANPAAEGPMRSRQATGSRRGPQRPMFSRPSCIYRRFLFNHRLMGNMLQVLRHPEVPESNRDYATPPPGYISRMVIESMRRENARDQNRNAPQNISVPLVQVNDVPINDMGQNAENPQRLHQPILSRASEYFQPFYGQNPNDENESRWSTTIRFTTECPSSSVHRIQVWDFTHGILPEISNGNKNIVVRKCKIHNDASIDISRDGRLLVALLPAQRMGNITHLLGIFSLEWSNLGECLYTTLLEQNAVSVSLSPCARHLAVGLGSRRVSLLPYVRNGVMAVIFRLGSVKMKENDTRLGSLIPIRSLEQSLDSGFTSLNCLRWAPQPGQGLVYANNKGQLKILS